MNVDAGNVNVFLEGRSGTAFVLWLCLGIGIAAAAGLLLPWPPDVGAAVMAAVVFFVCGVVAWQMGSSREVGFDRTTRTVVERITFAGLRRERRVVLADDARVQVTQNVIKVARPGTDSRHRTSGDYDSRPHYRLSLRSGSATVALAIDPDVLEVERRALEVAALCGVRAVRSGYAIEVERTPADAPPSVDTRRVVTVRSVAGAESAIAAAP